MLHVHVDVKANFDSYLIIRTSEGAKGYAQGLEDQACAGRGDKKMTSAGFEPAPIKTTALTWLLRPLGQDVVTGRGVIKI